MLLLQVSLLGIGKMMQLPEITYALHVRFRKPRLTETEHDAISLVLPAARLVELTLT